MRSSSMTKTSTAIGPYSSARETATSGAAVTKSPCSGWIALRLPAERRSSDAVATMDSHVVR